MTGVRFCLNAVNCIGVGSTSLGAPPQAAVVPITNGTARAVVRLSGLGILNGYAQRGAEHVPGPWGRQII